MRNGRGCMAGLACLCMTCGTLVLPGVADGAPRPQLDPSVPDKLVRTLNVAVCDPGGYLLSDVRLDYKDGAAQNVSGSRQTDGTFRIKTTGSKGLFTVWHKQFGESTTEFVVPRNLLNVSVIVMLNGNTARAIIGDTHSLARRGTTQTVAPVGNQALARGAGGGCDVICDPSTTPENEPNCGLPDSVNGGCLLTPPIFSSISCGETYCGTAAFDGTTRDTDWYELVITESNVITMQTTAEFDSLIGMVEMMPGSEGSGNCADTTGFVNPFATPLPCETITLTTQCLPAGTYWFFVAPTFDFVVPCGAEYTISLNCNPCVVPTGACCFSDGSCGDALTASAGAAQGGTYQGDNSDCATANCQAVCGPGSGDCCSDNGTPGCEDPTCCDLVCAADSFCCDTTWDGLCADTAAALCDPLCFVPAPANDLCDNPIAVAVPSTTPGSTDGATIDSAPECGTGVTSPGVWYSVTGTGNMMTASLCNGATAYDSKLSVYCADCIDFTCVDGNDDTCGLQSEVAWCSQAGAQYLILVHGFGGDSGPFELAISDNGSPCSGAVACLAEGGCCLPDASCAIMSEADCTAAAGGYLGDGSDCSGEPICAPGTEDATIHIEILTDDFPGETTWELVDQASGDVIASAGPLTAGATLHTWDIPVCSDFCYDFTIFDAFGDGICCGFGNGSYSVSFNGVIVGSGGSFGDSETVSNIGGCGGGGGCAPGTEDATITINLMTDDFPGETTLEVTDAGGTVIFSAGPFTAGATLHTFDVPVCSTGCYTFTIFDAFGDGICCGFGNGSYEVLYNGTVVGSGGTFGDFETVSNIADGCGGGGGCAPGTEDATITINLMTDDFPGETTLEVTDESGTVIFSAGPLLDPATLHTFNIPVCSTGCYSFTIFDAFGDGICCGFGNGSYEVLYNGTVVGSGGTFGDFETVSDIADGCGGGGGCAAGTEDATITIELLTDDF
ncbi:MAG: hypothetical protein ACE5GE_00650, partial [Phycisphaerae bacterium]